MNYINNMIPLAVNSEIIEYDIKSANTSIMREYKLLPDRQIDKIESLDKEDRHVVVGKLMKNDKELSKALEKSFNIAVEKFIETNMLSKENDIISIKKDAVFVINRNIQHNEFGYIHFIPKNTYNFYAQLKRLEFYGTHNKIDVKGISDEVLELHKNGMLNFIDCAFSELELRSKKTIINLFKEFASMYKKKELDYDYYREFNSDSKYRIITGKKIINLDNMAEAFIDNLDISYNYTKIVLPLMRLMIF